MKSIVASHHFSGENQKKTKQEKGSGDGTVVGEDQSSDLQFVDPTDGRSARCDFFRALRVLVRHGGGVGRDHKYSNETALTTSPVQPTNKLPGLRCNAASDDSSGASEYCTHLTRYPPSKSLFKSCSKRKTIPSLHWLLCNFYRPLVQPLGRCSGRETRQNTHP
jgi:hypothetical protein